MTDQTESASEYAVLLRNIDFAAAEFDGHPAIYEDAAAALRALEAKVQDLEYQLESTLRSCAGLKGLECVLRADRDRLAGEVENLRMQVVACGMAAQSNTRETHDAFTCHEDYRSASLNDVRAAVAREILHREEVARLTAELAAAREALDAHQGFARKMVISVNPFDTSTRRSIAEQYRIDAEGKYAARRAGGDV